MNIKGTTFSDVVKRVVNIPMMEVGKVAQKELIDYTRDKGWRRFLRAIKLIKVDKETVKIIVNNEKKDSKGASNSEIAEFLHSGTDTHPVAPVNKKALFWKGKVVASKGLSAKMKTQGFFSKGHEVTGIKALRWFRLTDETLDKINKSVTEFINKVKHG